ncbi:DUF308 domain-containing protein [Yangia mangrovi]|uniref:DUF308 domain-containing protein n=1 Tax=Alloyangia mangrovi TaxID=1779329 RepID=A0A2A3JVU2_9RHOB|nr:DUF308 domain-containing protein [Alloyangia mangrovi]MCA0941556.1 DUF308 domain-containing protein [Alloyangia pacifica]MCA0946394.1 DUF308 domain-containing protein [Alloyangia pacifica]MCT4372907.1 DUF308 domain-containing protein [Alloyangia mangrovi]
MPDGPMPSDPRKKWGWMLVLGIILILGGIGAFVHPFAASLTVLTISAIAFVAAGALQLWIAFNAQASTGARLAEAVLGLLVLAFGVFLLANPERGLVSLTWLIALFFLALGVVRIAIGFALRQRSGWIWLVFAGLVSVVLGVLIMATLPDSAMGLLGFFLGIDLLSSGIGATLIALHMRNH